MPRGFRWIVPALVLGAVLWMSGCAAKTPLEPVDRSPVVQSLLAFPSSIGPGDSAIVMCVATDPDGDQLVFDWTSNCQLLKQGESASSPTVFSRGNTLVVYVGSCAQAPLDVGWVSCDVRDRRGGGAYAGSVHIVIQQ